MIAFAETDLQYSVVLTEEMTTFARQPKDELLINAKKHRVEIQFLGICSTCLFAAAYSWLVSWLGNIFTMRTPTEQI